MAWLAGWNRRKQITVNGTVGAQSDYQMKLTVNQSGTSDSPGIISLGGNIKTSPAFADLRFTKSDGTTTLNYWIETITGSSPNLVATVWIKLAPSPDTIPASGTYNFYIYYNNPLAVQTSNGRNTFLVFDDFSTGSTEQWTKVDPGTQITIDRTTNHRIDYYYNYSNPQGIAYAYISKSIPSGFEIYFDAMKTNVYSIDSASLPGVSDTINDLYDATNCIYASFYYNSPNPNQTQIVSKVSGTMRGGTVNISSGAHYWIKLSVYNGSGTLYVYSNAARTSLIGSSTIIVPNRSFPYAFATSSIPGYRPESGWLANIFFKNYVSPEPTWGSVGTEQLPVTLNITSNPSNAEVWLASPTGSQWQDQFVQTSTTLYVPAGTSYDVEVGKGGYQPWTLINVCSGNCTAGSVYNIQANLIPEPGTISITSLPSGAEIYINDIDQNKTTTPSGTTISEPPGTYTITLKFTGYADWIVTGISITSNSTTTINATFSGSAYITSTPSNTSIYLDGSPTSIGNTPLTITNLTPTTSDGTQPTQTHTYILRLTGYTDTSGSFTATAGSTINVPVTFPGSLYVSSIPTGAQIYIDGILQ